MPDPHSPANLDSLSLSDTEADDTEDLFASPSLKRDAARHQDGNSANGRGKSGASVLSPNELDDDGAAIHEENLRRELASLKTMNNVISGITESLEKAKSNMETVSATVHNASNLLTTWTRILSQTEHNQRLILNPRWHGATQDLADGEDEELQKRLEKERREAEEEKRARQREVEREEDERKATIDTGKNSRGRGRGGGRVTVRSSGYGGVSGQGGTRGPTSRGGIVGRTGSGIGRGIAGLRGRSRA